MMDANSNQPIHQNQRTVIVDILRGWALFGVVLMNYYDFFTLDQDWTGFKPDSLTTTLMYLASFVFSAKSWTLLSLLFGYGFAVLMNNVKEKGHNAYGFFAGRMFWLFILAIINSALFFGDILKDYAFLGIVLLLFYRSSAKTTFVVSIILLLSIPAISGFVNTLKDDGWLNMSKLFPLYLSHNPINVATFGIKGTYFSQIVGRSYLYTVHVVMFCCMLWGFTLCKINFFGDLLSKSKYIKRTFWIALLVSIVLILLFTYGADYGIVLPMWYKLRYWSVLAIMLCIASGICWLYISGKLKSLFANFAIMGKMTLTNYMMQNLIGVFVFSGLGLGVWNTKPLWFYFLLAIVVYTVQVYISKWWLANYNYGPVEWLWRQLSYRKRLRLKKLKD